MLVDEFFFFFCKVSPHPHLTGGERGECHCYSNLIYHKRIAFVTWPVSKSSAAQPQTHKGKIGSGERRQKSKTKKRKSCLYFSPQLSTFREGSQTEHGWLFSFILRGNFQNGFRAKHKSTGKTWKATPPS